MKFLTLSLLAATLSLEAAVDPALLGMVMPDAAIIAGVRVDQAQASPFGRFLLTQLNVAAQREKLIQSTGFDPLRDLTEIVVASSGANTNKGIVLGRGTFQPSRVSSALGLLGGQASTYKGIDLLGGDRNNPGLAFLDASTVALGDAGDLRALIDRRGGTYTGSLAQGVRDASGSFDAWFVATSPAALAGGRLPQGSEMPARVLQTIKQVAGGVRFGSTSINVTADAMTASAQDAQALVDVLRFLVAMTDGDPKAPTLLHSAQFSANGAAARVSLDVPEKDAESLFKGQTARPARRAQVQPTR
jgi:hypothetical protein